MVYSIERLYIELRLERYDFFIQRCDIDCGSDEELKALLDMAFVEADELNVKWYVFS